MEYRHLGKSGLKVSELTYGNWITHGSQVEEDAAKQCVAAALDEGITSFDTADAYGGWHLVTNIQSGGGLFAQRLVTQMYFPGDPLFAQDPIFNSVTDEKARARMISSFDLENTQPEWALCYRFNMVLRGQNATPMETK